VGVVGVSCVEGKNASIEGEAVDDVDDGFGLVVGSNTKVADDLLVAHLTEGFHGAAFCEDGIDFLGDANVVEQPEVEVVVFMSLRDCSTSLESVVAAALPGLGTKEGVVAAVLDHAADVLLAPALGESVPGSGVDEVDPKIEASLDDGNGDVEVVGSFDSGLRAEGEEADLIAGLSKVARGHRGRRFRIGGHGRKLVLRGLGFVSEKAGGESASGLEELTAVREGGGLLHRETF